MSMEKEAIILVDFLNDFVTGPIGQASALEVIPRAKKLIEEARKKGVPLIYANDAHIEGVDNELKIWGPHALAGSQGADVVPELAPQKGDHIVHKRRYGAFFQTHMQMLLSELGVDTVYVCGLYTPLCVRHTVAEAYFHGFKVFLIDDATAAFSEEHRASDIECMTNYYGAKLTTVDEVIAGWN